MLRRHARRDVTVLELRGLVDGGARPDQVTRVARQPRPAASAIDQQFAFVPGDSALTYPEATSALRRCASSRPRTTLTCASTRAAHAATSSILAHATVSSVSVSARQAPCHGRLKLQEANPAEPLPSHLPLPHAPHTIRAAEPGQLQNVKYGL